MLREGQLKPVQNHDEHFSDIRQQSDLEWITLRVASSTYFPRVKGGAMKG